MGYWVDDLQEHQGKLKIGDIVCVLTCTDRRGTVIARVSRSHHAWIRRRRKHDKQPSQYFHFAFYGVVCRSDAAGTRFFVREILDPDDKIVRSLDPDNAELSPKDPPPTV
jgi:hypothetical protein